VIYLIDHSKPDDLKILQSKDLTPAQRTSLSSLRTATKALGSVPMILLLAVVNGFFETKGIPIRLIMVGNGM